MTATISTCRLLIEGADDGARQMALDEVLLESAAVDGIGTLRFYQWAQPTLSLGYFQPYVDRESHAASRDCPCVRRQTGGGAILHDRELTYSLAVPCAHPLAQDSRRLYDQVNAALARALAGYGLAATCCASAHERRGPQPFLCFQRRSPGDVLLGTTKICGSAQRRRRGALLQHGSLLLAGSRFSAELPGIFEVSGVAIAPDELSTRWGSEIGHALGWPLAEGELSAAERTAAERLTQEKYRQALWNRRR